MTHRLRHATMCLALGGLVFLGVWTATEARGQEQAPTLPDDVTTWMERDQTRRWSNMVRTGEELFTEGSCQNCHGEGGAGGRWGPDLTDDVWVQGDGGLQMIDDVIFWGVRRRDFSDSSRRFQMNPQGGMDLDYAARGALAAYVWTLSNGDPLAR